MGPSVDRIQLTGRDAAPTVSEQFKKQLRALDPTLCVRWNQPPAFSKRPPRFVIEQCVRHHAAGTEHDHTCQRIYVLICQDADGCMLPLGETVLEEIRARDVTKAGYGPNDLKKFCDDNQALVLAERKKMEQDQEDSIRHASKFNRRHLLRAVNLMGQHDVCRVHS